jgi:hypothetical protein
MVWDARDLKSLGGYPLCGFESHPRHSCYFREIKENPKILPSFGFSNCTQNQAILSISGEKREEVYLNLQLTTTLSIGNILPTKYGSIRGQR